MMKHVKGFFACKEHRADRCVVFCMSMLVTGCMGGESSDPELSPLERKKADAQQMFVDFAAVGYTPLSSVPTSGSVTYDGFVTGVLSNTSDTVTDTLIGDLSITVSFDEPEMVSGVANGFLDDEGNAMTGEIMLSRGELDRNGDPNVDATLTFEGNGELTAANGDVLSLETDFAGDFLGEQYDGVGGEALGQVSVNGVNQSFGGSFIAAR